MPVRKPERRIPPGFSADDLGEALLSPDSQCALVSFYSSPITQNRLQSYVVFLLDPALQNSVASYHWQAGDKTANTEAGVWEQMPADVGSLTVNASLLDDGGAELRTLSLTQEVVAANAELETLIAQDDAVHPIAGDPVTSREIINDLRAYMDILAPRNADSVSSLNRLLFAIAYVETLEQPAGQRNLNLERIAAAFAESDATTFVQDGAAGIGVCRIRPHALGMYLPVTPGGADFFLPKREYPIKKKDRLPVHNELLKNLQELASEKQIDLFNLLRFPKSNLKMAILLLQGLRAQYFPGDSLEAVIQDKAKTMALLDQFKNGPTQVA